MVVIRGLGLHMQSTLGSSVLARMMSSSVDPAKGSLKDPQSPLALSWRKPTLKMLKREAHHDNFS